MSEFKYLSERVHKSGMRARAVEASVHPISGTKLLTLEIRGPKFLDAERQKHRIMSISSSSSRAKPIAAFGDIFLPPDIRARDKGMQGSTRLEPKQAEFFRMAVEGLFQQAKVLVDHYTPMIHKQHLNRYLEPWMFQDSVVTATHWKEFFELREQLAEPDEMKRGADPNIQILARLMREAIETIPEDKWVVRQLASYPAETIPMHLPYLRDWEREAYSTHECTQLSAARCARTSYSRHGVDESIPIEKANELDIKRAESLRKEGHWVPFEHVATPSRFPRVDIRGRVDIENGITHVDRLGRTWSGNFMHWIQARQLVKPDWTGPAEVLP